MSSSSFLRKETTQIVYREYEWKTFFFFNFLSFFDVLFLILWYSELIGSGTGACLETLKDSLRKWAGNMRPCSELSWWSHGEPHWSHDWHVIMPISWTAGFQTWQPRNSFQSFICFSPPQSLPVVTYSPGKCWSSLLTPMTLLYIFILYHCDWSLRHLSGRYNREAA